MPAIRSSRGHLRIYLGAAAGVGKTYSMLGDGRLAVEEGTDLVISYLEPHGRAATAERARGLEHAPVIRHEGRTRAETEPDVDWLIRRRPSVALLDELAHTNAGGGPRVKRYQDIEHVLDHGIDVWTTVNVQHLESLNERVRTLTGVTVRETFPDRILHRADEVRLVDLSPGALRERIARGLVYPADRIDAALGGFFTFDNLIALRALALHELAEVAAGELEAAVPDRHARAGERVLVATGGRRDSMAQLIRAGARLARRSDSELYVLAIEPQDGRIDQATTQVLAEAELLTTSLGGTFLRRRSDDAAGEIVSEASAQRVTQIVLGKSNRGRLRTLLSGNVIDAVLRGTVGVDVHIVAPPPKAGARSGA